MVKIKCKFCGKKIDEKVKKCPKCHRILRRKYNKYIKSSLYILWILVQSLLCFILYKISKDSLYSEYTNDLFIPVGIIGLLIFNCIVMGIKIYKYKNIKNGLIFVGILVVCFSVFSFTYVYKVGKAFIYNNSYELLILSNNYDFKNAKKVKKEIENIFEYDRDNVFSRDIIISNLYSDGELFNLYIDDSYGNYRLKFYVEMDNFEIENVFWKFNDISLDLVKGGKKTDNFEYYYAMYIVDNVIGEEISGIARLDNDIEKVVGEGFEVSSNTMFNYEELEYNYNDNSFFINGDAYNMDYYADMEEKKFIINFWRRDIENSKHVWYYGDSSFDYVNWDVNI